MWLGPILFAGISVFLWRYIGAVFVPQLLARALLAIVPFLADLELLILIQAALVYFGAYFLFAVFWADLKPYFRNPFLAGVFLWLVNVLVVLPVLGRGVLGYRMPQGWMFTSLTLLLPHWMFARGLQFQERRT